MGSNQLGRNLPYLATKVEAAAQIGVAHAQQV
jgi:hypothetical protein